jgi:hypothetical protein
MGLAENSKLEWGYRARESAFMRAARAVVVATAIGASSGAAVRFSLVDQPMGEETVAARTLVHSVDSGLAAVSRPTPVANAGLASPAASQWSSTTQGPAITDTPPAQSPAASQWNSTTQGPAITDTPPAQIRTAATVLPSAKPERKPVPIKKSHYAQRSAPRYGQLERGPFAFFMQQISAR